MACWESNKTTGQNGVGREDSSPCRWLGYIGVLTDLSGTPFTRRYLLFRLSSHTGALPGSKRRGLRMTIRPMIVVANKNAELLRRSRGSRNGRQSRPASNRIGWCRARRAERARYSAAAFAAEKASGFRGLLLSTGGLRPRHRLIHFGHHEVGRLDVVEE